MDIVFEHNPRKRIPREVLDKWVQERGLRHTSEHNSEKKVEIHEQDV